MTAVPSNTKDRSWERKLTTYVVAGGAALGVADQAQASPIYSGLQNIAIGVDIGPDLFTDFDLNGDADVDYQFRSRVEPTFTHLDLMALGNAAVGSLNIGSIAEADVLGAGVLLPGGESFLADTELKMADTDPAFGQWPGVTNGYLGLRFDIGGQLHYGWARLSVDAASPFAATLHDWAYEGVAGASIATGDTGVAAAVPEPGTLSLLALGGAGLAAHRLRRRRQQARDGQS